MIPVDFPEVTNRIAEGQDQYMTLPAHINPGNQGEVTFCWQLTWKERMQLFLTGKLWHSVLTFNQPLQPQVLNIEKPEMLPQ